MPPPSFVTAAHDMLGFDVRGGGNMLDPRALLLCCLGLSGAILCGAVAKAAVIDDVPGHRASMDGSWIGAIMQMLQQQSLSETDL